MAKTRAEILAIIASGKSAMVTVNGERKYYTRASEVPVDAVLSAGNKQAAEKAKSELRAEAKRLLAEAEAIEQAESEEVGQDEPKAELTPGQKAAATRKANKKAEEEAGDKDE